MMCLPRWKTLDYFHRKNNNKTETQKRATRPVKYFCMYCVLRRIFFFQWCTVYNYAFFVFPFRKVLTERQVTTGLSFDSLSIGGKDIVTTDWTESHQWCWFGSCVCYWEALRYWHWGNIEYDRCCAVDVEGTRDILYRYRENPRDAVLLTQSESMTFCVTGI